MRSNLTVANSELLLSEWDYAENAKNGKKPDDVTLGSGYIASWICPKGHKQRAWVPFM